MNKHFILLTYFISSMFFTLQPAYALDKAPNWTLTTQNGQEVTLAQYQGKPVILHFWATWCPYCKKLQPTLLSLTEKYMTDDVVLLGVSFNEDEGSMPQTVLDERGHNFITAINGDETADLYGVVGTPTTFFINRKGQIIFKSTSSNTADPRLELAMKEIVKR